MTFSPVIVYTILVALVALVALVVVLGVSRKRLRREAAALRVELGQSRQRLMMANQQLAKVTQDGPRVQIQKVPVEVPREVIKTVEVIKPVPQQEPEVPADSMHHVGDPQVLPDVPDSLPDSTLDGARFGRLVVRAGSVRGDSSRQNGSVRKQTTSLSILTEFATPVLVACVATGRDDSPSHGQLGAAQVCRSLKEKLAERASALELAWEKAETGQGEELNDLLYGVAVALNGPLIQVARERELGREAVATELLFLLTQLGDTDSRRHLVAGVGAGALLRLSAAGACTTEFQASQSDGRPAMLPGRPDAIAHQTLRTGPGETLLLCSRTGAAYVRRAMERGTISREWSAGPPQMTRFLWQLSLPDQVERRDRSLVGLWETR